METKITAADVVAGRATPAQFIATLSPAKATAAALAVAAGIIDRGEAGPDVAGITACTVVPQADVASVRAILEGRASLVARV